MSQSEEHGAAGVLPRETASTAARIARFAAAREAYVEGDSQRALEICEAELRPDESEIDWLLLHAELLVAVGRHIPALDDCMAVLRQNPRQPEAMFRIGFILFEFEEAFHAERYLAHAVQLSGGKSSYAKLHRRVRRKALLEGAHAHGSVSTLPTADDDLGSARVSVQERVHENAAVQKLLGFENDIALFETRMTQAVEASRQIIPRGLALIRTKTAKRIAAASVISLLVIVAVIVVFNALGKRMQASEDFSKAILQLDADIASGGAKQRVRALQEGRGLIDADSDAEVGLRLAWLLCAQYLYESSDSAVVKEAGALLDRFADPDSPRAIVAAALHAVARRAPPGALATQTPFADPLFESMRQEVLALDALGRGEASFALQRAVEAASSRANNSDLAWVAAQAALSNVDEKVAKGWVQKFADMAPDTPRLALLNARLQYLNKSPAAQIASLLGPAVADDAPARVRYPALAFAVSLRSELSDQPGTAPPFADIEKIIVDNPAQAPLAAQALLDEGWVDFAARALEVAKVEVDSTLLLAIAVAAGDLQQAETLLADSGVLAIPYLWDLATQAAAVGKRELADNCLARLELFGAPACTLSATKARVAQRRGQQLSKEQSDRLKACPLEGPAVLWLIEDTIARQQKEPSFDVRSMLLQMRFASNAGLDVLGAWSLHQKEPVRADEAGKMILARTSASRTGLALRMRAALTVGDTLKALAIFNEAGAEQQKSPVLVALAAMSHYDRSETKAARATIDNYAKKNPEAKLDLHVAIRSLATLSSRNAKQQLAVLEVLAPTPYVNAASAQALTLLGEFDRARKALDNADHAPELRLQTQLWRAEIFFAQEQRSNYRKVLQEVQKQAEGAYGNAPIATEALLRRVIIIEDNSLRQEQLDSVDEMLQAWRRRDRKSQRLANLTRIRYRYKSKPLEFPKQ